MPSDLEAIGPAIAGVSNQSLVQRWEDGGTGAGYAYDRGIRRGSRIDDAMPALYLEFGSDGEARP